MLSRHFLRSKVLQALYAAQVDPVDVVVAEKNFKHHIFRLNDLGTLQLASLVHMVEVAGVMMEEAQHKFLPTEEERNPNRRLAENQFVARLADNYDLRRHMEESHVNWGGVEYDELFRQAYATLSKMAEYKAYLATERTFENDREFAVKLFKYMMNNEVLRDLVCQQSLLWEDDFDQIAQYNFMMLKTLEENSFDEAMMWPVMYDKRVGKDEADMEFARELLRGTLATREESEELIKEHLQGWEFERVSRMDVLLINMAVAELTGCPTIPEKVTVDEYIELSKEFSAERSRLFINGILDKLIAELRSRGRINKIVKE